MAVGTSVRNACGGVVGKFMVNGRPKVGALEKEGL